MTEAILLAGGLGTRLRASVMDLPKSMAPINSKPFLAYQIEYLKLFGIEKIIIATGYLSEAITSYFGDKYLSVNIEYSHEKEPLGTGGAIKQALSKTTEENILILNGDTMFKVDLNAFTENHLKLNADCSLALKPLKNFERYGLVEVNNQNKIIGFEEKKIQAKGYINGGVYILNKMAFNQYKFDLRFSFEKEFLEIAYQKQNLIGFVSTTYFLDIGIPKDYEQAQVDFKLEFN